MEKAKAPRHLLHVFSTFAVGGPQTRFVSLANTLNSKYRHTVLAMDGNHEAAAGLDRQLDCTFENMPVVKSGGISVANLRNARDVLRRLQSRTALYLQLGFDRMVACQLVFSFLSANTR